MTKLSVAQPSLEAVMQAAAATVLDEMMAALSGLIAGVIATSDGFEIAARGRADLDVAKLAAMACSMSALGVMVGTESEIGQYRSVVIEADEGYMVIMEILHPYYPMIMNLVVGSEEVLGQVLYRAKRAAARLALV